METVELVKVSENQLIPDTEKILDYQKKIEELDLWYFYREEIRKQVQQLWRKTHRINLLIQKILDIVPGSSDSDLIFGEGKFYKESKFIKKIAEEINKTFDDFLNLWLLIKKEENEKEESGWKNDKENALYYDSSKLDKDLKEIEKSLDEKDGVLYEKLEDLLKEFEVKRANQSKATTIASILKKAEEWAKAIKERNDHFKE